MDPSLNKSHEVIQEKEAQQNRLSGEHSNVVKRQSIYAIPGDPNPPFNKKAEVSEPTTPMSVIMIQPSKINKKSSSAKETTKKTLKIDSDFSSSDDDEEFIRQSIINNQKRFSNPGSGLIEQAFINRINEHEEHKEQEREPIMVISSDETPNGLSKLCGRLNSLNELAHDKSDRIFTNFDTLLFYLEVSDAIKLQK